MINQNPIDDAAGYYEYSINHGHTNPTKSSKEAVKDNDSPFQTRWKILSLKYLYLRPTTSFPKEWLTTLAIKLTRIQYKSTATFKNYRTICKRVPFYKDYRLQLSYH